MACGEFSLIARYFDRVRTSRLDVETGIGDDCALLNIPEKQTLAISTDTLVCGRHFYPISILPIWRIKRWRSTSAIWRRWGPIRRG
jgi:thiamine monophosphate kinase